MNQTSAWIHALRLRTLPLSLAGIIMGSALAHANSPSQWSALTFGLALLTTVLFQLVSNLANDLGDSQKGTDNANRVGPVRAVQSGAISQGQMSRAVAFTSVLSFLSAAALIVSALNQISMNLVWFYVFLALACILAAILYTVGKRAYGYNGLGDVMVLLFFGFVSVLGIYPLLTGTLDILLIFPALAIGLLSTGVLNLNNLRDHVNDAQSGKRTLVVLLGFDRAKRYHTLLISLGMGCLTFYLIYSEHYLALIGLLPFVIILQKHVQRVAQCNEPKLLDPELKIVALSTFGIAVLTGILIQF